MMTNDELLHKWINQTISEEELEEFKQRPEFESLKSLYENTADFKAPAFDGEGMLKEILASPKEKVVPGAEKQVHTAKRANLPLWIKFSVAASVLVLIGFFLWPKNNLVEFSVAKNEQVRGTLPDGSEFVLNADSKMTYDVQKWDSHRKLKLSGEAFFKVQKGATFTVNTPLGKVEVLGTEFNVKTRAGNFEVSCQEGKVAVSSKQTGGQETLEAGQSVRINRDGSVERLEGESANANSWTSGITKLNNVTAKELIAELERQFDIQIETRGIELSQKISCNFQHQNLELALKTATAPLGIEFEILDTKKVVLRK